MFFITIKGKSLSELCAISHFYLEAKHGAWMINKFQSGEEQKAVLRTMCGVKFMDRKNTSELMTMLSLTV